MRLLFLILVITYCNLYSQETIKSNTPRISFVYSNVIFIDKIVTKSHSRSIPGSMYCLPVVTYDWYLLYNLKFAINVHDRGKISPTSLSVRIISPNKVSQKFLLADDLTLLNMERIYDFSLEIRTKETGWYKIEIGSFVDSNGNVDPIKSVVYDESSIFFNK